MSGFKNRFPNYNVLDKWNTPSWNEKTREAVGRRLHKVPERQFFDPQEWETLEAVCSRIIPQPDRPNSPVPIAPFIDRKMHQDLKDGYRYAKMPSMQEAWKMGLRGIDEESQSRFGPRFRDLALEQQDEILRSVQKSEVKGDVWDQLPPELFFKSRLLHDITSAYYSHPAAWNEMGFGGPASPRGYVRLGFNRRDPWEAEEVIDE